MTAATVVERFEIVNDVVPGLGERTLMLVMRAFGLEGSEKALATAFVITDTGAAHAGLDMVGGESERRRAQAEPSQRFPAQP